MKLRWKLGIAIPVVLLAVGVVCWFTVDDFQGLVYVTIRGAQLAIHPPPPRCKQRADQFAERVERIKQSAKTSLKIGTKKDAVLRFFASENIKVDFVVMARQNEATGTTFVTGDPECSSIACGNDSALIGVRVDVDSDGTVVSDPVVVGMYTDCL
jgi:hypothetical protein